MRLSPAAIVPLVLGMSLVAARPTGHAQAPVPPVFDRDVRPVLDDVCARCSPGPTGT